MKNCIFMVFVVSISSNIIGSEEQISTNKKRTTATERSVSMSDSCLLIPNKIPKKKSLLKSVSSSTQRKECLEIKHRLGAFESHLDLHKSNNLAEFNQNLRKKKRSPLELRAIISCPICFGIIQKNYALPKESCNNNNN